MANQGIRISNSFSPDEIMGWADIMLALQRGDRPDMSTKISQQLAKKAIKMRKRLEEKKAEQAKVKAEEKAAEGEGLRSE